MEKTTTLEESWERIHQLMKAENECLCSECEAEQKTEAQASGEELG
jgi:hypothetical protein